MDAQFTDYPQPNEAGCGFCHFVETSGLTSAKDRIADLTQSGQISG